jgi:histidinol dehydrogenase
VVRRLDATAPGFAAAFAELIESERDTPEAVDAVVAEVLAAVQRDGDRAVADLTERFDGVSLAPEQFRVSQAEIDAAVARCDPAALAALEVAATRIEAFHRLQMPSDVRHADATGTTLGLVWRPVAAAGLYVPGGTAAYPSSVLMNAMPARVAAVPRIVMVTPPQRDAINPLVLAAARRAGVSEIYRIGGAQAIAALAFGTATIPAVDKIVGPGNAYVAAAKRQVFGRVGIDSIAGPSEILVVADGANNPDWIAADLMSQAEHDASSQAILITDDTGFADRVVAAVARLLAVLPRTAIASAAWADHGAVIVVPNLSAAVPLIDAIAPEHLELAIEQPDAFAARIRNAGAVFLGRYTPEAIGDYVAGPNHVLPTMRTARHASGLSTYDFLKRTTHVQCTPASLALIGPAAVALAAAEGLDGHRRSVAIRLE